jgi:hypothetical protein
VGKKWGAMLCLNLKKAPPCPIPIHSKSNRISISTNSQLKLHLPPPTSHLPPNSSSSLPLLVVSKICGYNTIFEFSNWRHSVLTVHCTHPNFGKNAFCLSR